MHPVSSNLRLVCCEPTTTSIWMFLPLCSLYVGVFFKEKSSRTHATAFECGKK